MEKLRPLANFYGLSTRRLYDYVRKGQGLGISYRDGKIVTFNGQDIAAVDEIMGPIPDEPHRYIVPVGTSGTQVKFVSGISSAAIYQGHFFPYTNRPSQVELWAHKGYSGVIASIVPDPKV